MSVTIIVPTKNSAASLRACLQSCVVQDGVDEVIVIDNHSDDESPLIAASIGCEVVTAGPERSAQRNLGARRALGKWLLFVDSDMILPAGLVRGCIELVGTSQTTTVVIPEVITGSGFFARCRGLEKQCYAGDPDIEAPRFISKQLFESVGGYDEALNAGEDWDLAIRLREEGAQELRLALPITHDEGRISLRETYRTKLYYGRSIARYRRKHPDIAARQMSPLRASFIRNWKLLTRRPILALGLVVLKGTEFVGLLRGTRIGAAQIPSDNHRRAEIARTTDV